jgi:hypothetical protein
LFKAAAAAAAVDQAPQLLQSLKLITCFISPPSYPSSLQLSSTDPHTCAVNNRFVSSLKLVVQPFSSLFLPAWEMLHRRWWCDSPLGVLIVIEAASIFLCCYVFELKQEGEPLSTVDRFVRHHPINISLLEHRHQLTIDN